MNDPKLEELLNTPHNNDNIEELFLNIKDYVNAFARVHSQDSDFTDKLSELLFNILLKTYKIPDGVDRDDYEKKIESFIEEIYEELDSTYYLDDKAVEDKVDNYFKEELLKNKDNLEEFLNSHRDILNYLYYYPDSLFEYILSLNDEKLAYSFFDGYLKTDWNVGLIEALAKITSPAFDDLKRKAISLMDGHFEYASTPVDIFKSLSIKTDKDVELLFSKLNGHNNNDLVAMLLLADYLTPEQIDLINFLPQLEERNADDVSYQAAKNITKISNPAIIEKIINKIGVERIATGILILHRDNPDNVDMAYSDNLLLSLLSQTTNTYAQKILITYLNNEDLIVEKLKDLDMNEVFSVLEDFLVLDKNKVTDYLLEIFDIHNIAIRISGFLATYNFSDNVLLKILDKIEKANDVTLEFNYMKFLFSLDNKDLMLEKLENITSEEVLFSFINRFLSLNDDRVIDYLIKRGITITQMARIANYNNPEIVDKLIRLTKTIEEKKELFYGLVDCGNDQIIIDTFKKIDDGFFPKEFLIDKKINLIGYRNTDIDLYLIDNIDIDILLDGLINAYINLEFLEVVISKFGIIPQYKDFYLMGIRQSRDFASLMKYIVKLGDLCTAEDIIGTIQAFNKFEHTNKIGLEYSEEYKPIIEKVATYYNINTDRFLTMAKNFGCSIILIADHPNIKEIMNLNDTEFKRLMEILNSKKMDKDSFNNSFTAIKTNEFNTSRDNYNVINMFTIIENLIPKDGASIEEINIARSNIDSALYEICKVVNLDKYNITREELLEGIISKNPKILNLLHDEIINDFISTLRFAFVEGEKEEFSKKWVDKVYLAKDLYSALIEQLPTEQIIGYLTQIDKSLLSSDELALINNPGLLEKLIDWKKDPKSVQMDDEIKRNIYILEKLCKHLDYKKISLFLGNASCQERFNKIVDERLNIINAIITSLDVSRIKENILANEEIYKKLMEHLTTYSILDWIKLTYLIYEYNGKQEAIDIEEFLAYITEYPLILKERENEEKKGHRVSITGDIDYAGCLTSFGRVFASLLEFENFKIIKSNRGNNRAPMASKERLAKAIQLLKTMHDRKKITIPPIDKNIELSKDKSINVSVGDTYSPVNLTYGERTGACMRIGGAGETLLYYCIENINGFHVSFTNPLTGEIVSRISGFRNGPTLCLNQLRDSLDLTYSNEEIITACKIFAQMIIEKTKDSKYPITNVVAAMGCALGKHPPNEANGLNFKEGMDPSVYTNLGHYYIPLATSNDGKIEFGPEKCEEYDVSRCKPKLYEGKDALDKMNHIYALDQLFQGKELCDINALDYKEEDIKCAFVGEDWYIALMTDNSMISYLSETSRDKTTALSELKKYTEELKKKIEQANQIASTAIFEEVPENENNHGKGGKK